MKWKLLGIVAVILTLLGVLLFTEQGRKYAIVLGSMTRSFTNLLGNFLGSIVRTSSTQEFEFEMSTNKEAVYGQSFSFTGTRFKALGPILTLSIDGKNWEIGEKSEVELIGNGEVLIGSDGKLSLKADASLFKLGSLKTNEVKIEIEMIPENFSLTNAKVSLINMTSASGYVKKKMENIELKADFNKASLKIENFFGAIEFKEEAWLSGIATNIEVNGKKI
ncbi:MAG: hypothetical protein QXL86_00390 [Candidatus Aenigmatarchaeota archaeon]